MVLNKVKDKGVSQCQYSAGEAVIIEMLLNLLSLPNAYDLQCSVKCMIISNNGLLVTINLVMTKTSQSIYTAKI